MASMQGRPRGKAAMGGDIGADGASAKPHANHHLVVCSPRAVDVHKVRAAMLHVTPRKQDHIAPLPQMAAATPHACICHASHAFSFTCALGTAAPCQAVANIAAQLGGAGPLPLRQVYIRAGNQMDSLGH